MIPEPRTIVAPEAMTYDRLLEKIRYEGAYPTRERAEEVLRAVMGGLGRQVTGEERVAFAAALPREAALMFTAEAPGIEPSPAARFVDDLAARTGGTAATARWDAGTVLVAVSALMDPALVAGVIEALPTGYALLFGRAQLATAA
ncbi:DUF2267 domain-containing protein [Streptomyces microflavus]|uniref:DUF2267 domain-containing protein n=1 Tax=Streptomyces microflavus TaxID=1919 RepID=UPI003803757F|nr:DUF2267 domain-containing protein [Streptomyces microflavus]WST12942.1 DUF2267 domain-containing protein [Streptomyces microflavus]